MPPKPTKEVPLTADLEKQLAALNAGGTVEQWKSLGNACFTHGSHLTAIKCYTKAIDQPGGDTAVLRSNRSAAYLKSTMFSGPALALKDAEKAVEQDPKWFKGFLRLGDAQFKRKKFEEAQQAYERALALDPTCTTAKDSLHELKKEVFLRDLDRQENERMRAEAAKDDEDLLSGQKAPSGAAARAAGPAAGLEPPKPRSGGMEFHNAPIGSDVDPTGRTRQPTEEETAQLIQAWKKDTTLVEERTAMKPRNVSLDEADRQAGQSYKANLMGNFRNKVSTNTNLRDSIQQRREAEMLEGAKGDYKAPEPFRTQYARATNGIGLGITTDAYKEHTGTEHRW